MWGVSILVTSFVHDAIDGQPSFGSIGRKRKEKTEKALRLLRKRFLYNSINEQDNFFLSFTG